MGWKMPYNMNKDILAKLAFLRKFTQNKCAEDNNMNSKNTNDQVSLKEYNNTIREMINHENEIRNQRTNWFLVIQGFLIAGICDSSCTDMLLKYIIVFVGAITSISFWHAAWRSTLATTYALSWWEVNKGKESEGNLPPVSLIAKNILDAKKRKLIDKGTDIFAEMKQRLNWVADSGIQIRNKLDWLLPYRFLPSIFFLFWIVYGIVIKFSNIEDVSIPKEISTSTIYKIQSDSTTFYNTFIENM